MKVVFKICILAIVAFGLWTRGRGHHSLKLTVPEEFNLSVSDMLFFVSAPRGLLSSLPDASMHTAPTCALLGWLPRSPLQPKPVSRAPVLLAVCSISVLCDIMVVVDAHGGQAAGLHSVHNNPNRPGSVSLCPTSRTYPPR